MHIHHHRFMSSVAWWDKYDVLLSPFLFLPSPGISANTFYSFHRCRAGGMVYMISPNSNLFAMGKGVSPSLSFPVMRAIERFCFFEKG